ncbi:hypothetical protein cypCar_00019655 [Cyprinus carpio]|nr:hypothetical protein cypCar_00019655 [Cyprinus carpio]
MDYKEQVEQVVSTAQFGDLIEFSYPIGYAHWGVYDGDGYVIHFSVAVNVPKGARVAVSNDRHDLEPSPVEEIRKRRDALLDKEFTYKLFTHNCEHFATFVRSGKAMCNQIPGKPKNKECVESTQLFSYLVPSS